MNPIQEITPVAGVAPASVAAGNADSTAVDASALYEPDVCVVLTCGVLGASATALAKAQESADGSTAWTDICTTATATKASNDGTVLYATGRATKRYLRVRLTVGTATSLVGAHLMLKKRTIT